MSARRSVDPFSSAAPRAATPRADRLAKAHGPPAATRAAVLLAALAALAAGGWRRPCGDGEIDIPVKRTVVGVFQFLGGWNVGSPKGSTGYAVLNFAALADGTRVQCRTDWGLLEQLKIGRPYQCSIDYRVDTRWLTSAEEYNLQPWELRARLWEEETADALVVQDSRSGESQTLQFGSVARAIARILREGPVSYDHIVTQLSDETSEPTIVTQELLTMLKTRIICQDGDYYVWLPLPKRHYDYSWDFDIMPFGQV
jgi:hypothetical protein